MSEWAELGGRLLVVFDGHCGLCNRAVRWFLRRDARNRMRFAPSEMARVAALLTRLGVTVDGASDGPGSIVVMRAVESELPEVLLRSDAVAAMLKELPQPWPLWGGALRLIPRPVRDWGYGIVARWRYRIWGRLDACPLPSEQERERFL
jgi:predicted DCC family thiol-disulfide oxidoreductase YuxK